MNPSQVAEAARQQQLLRTLWRDDPPSLLAEWLRGAPERQARGLAAYRANAGALAERALAAAYPVTQQLIGSNSFGALARAYWRAQAPSRGDLGSWGATLAEWIAGDQQLADEAYLADIARLEWAVHLAETAADPGAAPAGLERLAEVDPAAAWLCLVPGAAVVASEHPVASIWHAHHSDAADRFSPVREALAEGRAERAFVWRCGLRVVVAAVEPAHAAFMVALLERRSIAEAIDAAGEAFDFESWLIAALRQGWLAGLSLAREDNTE